MVEFSYAEFLLCQESCILSVLNKPYTLSVVMPNVIMLSVVAPYCSLHLVSNNLPKLTKSTFQRV
jgi:hypothetical protein